MKHWQILRISIFILAFSLPGHADRASSAYKAGVSAEAKNDYDAAYEAFKQAYDIKPKDAKYLTSYARLRFYASTQHLHVGQLLRDSGKLAEALTEFRRAAEIDRTSFAATQELHRTADMMRKQEQHESAASVPQSPLTQMAEQAEGPVELAPMSSTPINLRLSENADMIYKIIAKLAGVNVLFDPDYKAQRISVELNDVTAREALDMVALESKTFWQPASMNTIFVASDTPGKRKDLQSNVMTTFYLRNVSTPGELSDAANTLKGILDINRIQLNPTQNAIILRGTKDQLVLAEKLLRDIDKPKPEVIIDIAVMQVSRDRIRNMGTTPPTSTSLSISPPGSGSGSGGSGQLTLNNITSLNASNFLIGIPGASFSFLMSDSNTKLLQNPEIRALDNEKATLKIGDRVPIATGSFQAGLTGGGGNPLVNTQFQYLDVGVNIDITPHVHSEREVTLKMVLEISSVTGSENIGGISQPIIGQRRIEHETRLMDGEVNLVGGILEDSETQSLSGYPWLTKIPILRYLFGQEDKERRENEIVFAITPHIVRGQEVNEQNLRLVDVGTGSAVGLRHTRRSEPSPSPTPAGPALQNTPGPSKSPNAPRRGAAPVTPSAPKSGQAQPAASQVKPDAATQASADPCPYGQHAVENQKDVVYCAFD